MRIDRRFSVWLGVAAALSLGVACGGRQRTAPRVYRMGERVQVGPFIYNVLDTEWKTQLGEGVAARTPKNRFLILQLTITNSGGSESAIPPITLENVQGSAYQEVTNGDGVTAWLGLLRKLAPAETEQGRILFDVPPGAYRLRVLDDGELGRERSALIDIPLRMEPEPTPLGRDIPDATLPERK